jgi:hypothetical protein
MSEAVATNETKQRPFSERDGDTTDTTESERLSGSEYENNSKQSKESKKDDTDSDGKKKREYRNLGSINWQEMKEYTNIPLVLRYVPTPETLKEKDWRIVTDGRTKVYANVGFDRSFIIAKMENILESAGLKDEQELSSLLDEVKESRMESLRHEKQRQKEEVIEKIKELDLSYEDIEELFFNK